jgi:hypothetical protein
MFSIEEARSAHAHATYNIAAGARREYGTESIIRDLEMADAQARVARRDMLVKAVMALYSRLTGRNRRAISGQQAAPDVALGLGN